MPEPRRRLATRAPRMAAGLAVALALWVAVRGREVVRATVRVREAGRPGAPVVAVVEGPAAAVAALYVRPPVLRRPAAPDAGEALAALRPDHVELPPGMRGVTVLAVRRDPPERLGVALPARP
jgi:hypothetical protein